MKDYLKEHTLEELADWFKNHRLKPWAYNTLIFFNIIHTNAKQNCDILQFNEINWNLLEIFYKKIYNELTAITKQKILWKEWFYEH